MDNTIENILLLLDNLLHCKNRPLIEPVDWEKLFKISSEQNILALIVESLVGNYDTSKITDFDKYKNTAMLIASKQMRRTMRFINIYQALKEAGVYPIVFKGLVCRQIYGDFGDMRPSGDEDIFIKREDFSKLSEILLSNGFVTQAEELTDEYIDVSQEISFYDKKNGLHIEAHINIMGNDYDYRAKMNKYFENVFERSIETEVDGVSIRTMNYTDHFLYLIFHSFKHFVGAGLGVRQMIDVLMYDEKYTDKIDWEYIYTALKECKADMFFSDFLHIGKSYMSFQTSPQYKANCPQNLLCDMFGGGVFGMSDQVHRTAISVVRSAIIANGDESKPKQLITMIFPTRKMLLKKNPELLEKPWCILPIWVKRWIMFISHTREADGNLIKESTAIGSRRVELLKKYNIL